MKIAHVSEMRKMDAAAAHEYGMSEELLMENATIGLSRASVNVVRSPRRRMTSPWEKCAPHCADWVKNAAKRHRPRLHQGEPP